MKGDEKRVFSKFDFDKVGQLVNFYWTRTVSGSADLWLLEGTSISSPLVVAVSRVFVNVFEVRKEFQDELFFTGQQWFWLGHGVTDEQLATVGGIRFFDGTEKGLVVDHRLGDVSLGSEGKAGERGQGETGQDQSFSSDGQGS